MKVKTTVLALIALAALAGFFGWRQGERQAELLPSAIDALGFTESGEAAPRSPQQSSNDGWFITPHPTDDDPVGDLRTEASEFAADEPESKDPAFVLPRITDYLQTDDPVVRRFGAASVSRIARSKAAHQSGLRDTAARDTALVGALFDTLGYIYPTGYEDQETRAEAARAIGMLWVESPNPTVETELVDQYWNEFVTDVRFAIVGALCDNRYNSGSAVEVYQHASGDYESSLATLGSRCLEQLQ